MGLFGNNSPLTKGLKRTKKSEAALEPLDEKARLGPEFYERKSFNGAGGDTSFLSWTDYSMTVKKFMAEKYNYCFSKQWDRDKENVLHGHWERRLDIETAAKSLV